MSFVLFLENVYFPWVDKSIIQYFKFLKIFHVSNGELSHSTLVDTEDVDMAYLYYIIVYIIGY